MIKTKDFKMLPIKLNRVLLLLILHVCKCQRRIKDGEIVEAGKNYVVYLLRAPASPQYYSGWVCGGALVSTEYIVTSAACVTDVQHLYAIAGYKEYVSDEDVNNNECTKHKKKKIVLICTPEIYELSYENLEKWAYVDIAVVKVESPYDFNDNSYARQCSYTPGDIKINYEMKYQEPGTDSIVFGWGHRDKWREVQDPEDHNEKSLNYAPTLIQEKEECKKQYEVYPGMEEVIDNYMICTHEKGNIDALGETIVESPPIAQGCSSKNGKRRARGSVSCESIDRQGGEVVLVESIRRNGEVANETRVYSDQKHNISLNNEIYRNKVDSNVTYTYSPFDKLYNNVKNPKQIPRTRRQGICQNDHGGPLVTWVGSHEILIGVASVFKITESNECIGPYLYTSTQCNGAFLDCILSSDQNKNDEARRALCESPPSVKGFDIIERYISWKGHPHGPADNEKDTTTNTTNVLIKHLTNALTTNTTNISIQHLSSASTTNTTNISIQHLSNASTTNTINISINPLSNTSTTNTTNATNILMDHLSNTSTTTNISNKHLSNTSTTNRANSTTSNIINSKKEEWNSTTISNAVNITTTNPIKTPTNDTNYSSSKTSQKLTVPTTLYMINTTDTNLIKSMKVKK